MKRLYPFLLTMFCGLSMIHAQITIDGDISEADWGTPLSEVDGTSALATNGFGADYEITAFYATFDGTDLNFALAGQVLDGNSIVIFVDGGTGGYSDCNFGRTSAPEGIDDINSGITFDTGFTPEFAICIENFSGTYFWNTFVLAGTAGGGGGTKAFLGSDNMEDPTAALAGIEIGTDPIGGGSKVRGFEASLPSSTLPFTPGTDVKIFAMLLSKGGFLSNQFLGPAGSGEGNYGNGSVTFGAAAPDPFTYTFPVFPVELFDFSGAITAEGASLNWTAVEEAFSHYEVQRQVAGEEFVNIDRVEVTGVPGEVNSYQYLDRTASSEQTLLYRLAMVDIDGSVTYSNHVELNAEDSRIMLSPNPTEGLVSISLPSGSSTDIAVEAYNLSGQLVYSETVSSQRSTLEMDLTAFPAGLYQLVVKWGGQREMKKITLR